MTQGDLDLGLMQTSGQVNAWNHATRMPATPLRANLAAVVGDADAASYLVPGLAVQGSEGDGQCPTGTGGMQESFARWQHFGLGGGFLWTYDATLKNAPCPGPANLAAYVAAINAGLG